MNYKKNSTIYTYRKIEKIFNIRLQLFWKFSLTTIRKTGEGHNKVCIFFINTNVKRTLNLININIYMLNAFNDRLFLL